MTKPTKEKVKVKAYLTANAWLGLIGRTKEWGGRSPTWFRIDEENAIETIAELNFQLFSFEVGFIVEKIAEDIG